MSFWDNVKKMAQPYADDDYDDDYDEDEEYFDDGYTIKLRYFLLTISIQSM